MEWAFSPEENATGFYFPEETTLRILLVARYLGYQMYRVLFPERAKKQVKGLKKVKIQHTVDGDGLHVTFTVGDKQIVRSTRWAASIPTDMVREFSTGRKIMFK